jgi:hypothetical protein
MEAMTRPPAESRESESSRASAVDGLVASPVKIDWHPSLQIYASEAFLKTVGDDYGWLGGFDGAGELRCVLPYTIVKKAFFRMVRFRVETIPIGGDLKISEEKSFLNSVVEYFRTIRADMIIPATTNTIFRTYPDGAVAAPYGTFIIDLEQPEETLMANLNSSHRRKVRLAMKNGVKIQTGIQYLETAYHLVRETFGRSNLGFMNLDAFRRMVLGLGDEVKIFVAEHQGVVQGCTVVPFSRHTAYYVYGGSIPEPAAGSMNMLHWAGIRQFRELGVKYYDFVGVRINPEKGSKQEGLMMFKERFGGSLLQGYMWKYSFHSLKYFAYCLGVRLLRRGDIVDQERFRAGRSKETRPSFNHSYGAS